MAERYDERVLLAFPAIECDDGVKRDMGSPEKRAEVRHRCGQWVRKDLDYCGNCGMLLRRKDGTLI